jgi:mRNA interferase RelE/StbE
MKPVSYARSAQKALKAMPRTTAERIVSKINLYALDPALLANNVKTLKGAYAGLVRLRVGDWRVIMDDKGQVLHIIEVKPRGGAYE